MSPWKNSEYERVVNGVIWKKCPKDIYVGRSTLEMGVDSAVFNFNFGGSHLFDVLKEYGFQNALYTYTLCRKKDISRIKGSCRKESDKGKASQKRLRAVREGFGDKEIERELCMDLVSVINDKIVFFMIYVVLVFKTIYLTFSVIF